MPFDAAALVALRAAKEIEIRASRPKNRAVPIWVVVVDDAVYIRSVRGTRGIWFLAAKADGTATIAFEGRDIGVRTVHVTDAATIDAVSRAFLSKYAGSPWAQAIVAAETLDTTLRLEPAGQ